MSDATYAIKPLQWEIKSDGNIAACKIGPYWISAYAWGGWHVQARGVDGCFDNIADGEGAPDIESAKLAAESAYRKLIAEHLVVITPSTHKPAH